jgi:hypothetical protein
MYFCSNQVVLSHRTEYYAVDGTVQRMQFKDTMCRLVVLGAEYIHVLGKCITSS